MATERANSENATTMPTASSSTTSTRTCSTPCIIASPNSANRPSLCGVPAKLCWSLQVEPVPHLRKPEAFCRRYSGITPHLELLHRITALQLACLR
jgi:hypothetical protein